MTYILNIGLARDGNSNIGVGTVLRELADRPFTVFEYKVHHSDTEMTVVAKVTVNGPFTNPSRQFHNLARVLGQDCIAAYHVELQRGELAGPNAAAWGTFNPEFFLMLDGSRLAPPSLPRAA